MTYIILTYLIYTPIVNFYYVIFKSDFFCFFRESWQFFFYIARNNSKKTRYF